MVLLDIKAAKISRIKTNLDTKRYYWQMMNLRNALQIYKKDYKFKMKKLMNQDSINLL